MFLVHEVVREVFTAPYRQASRPAATSSLRLWIGGPAQNSASCAALHPEIRLGGMRLGPGS
jgi:hypothetical protein